MANWPSSVTTSALTGGRWTKQVHGAETMLVGFVPMLDADIDKLLPFSGTHGIFLNKLDPAGVRKPIQWLHRQAHESSEAYFRRSHTQANSARQPLFFRKGTSTSNLGVPAQDDAVEKTRELHLDARGIPIHWEREELQHFLTDQGWTAIRTSHKKPRGRHTADWMVIGKAPANSVSAQEVWTYEDKDNMIHIRLLLVPSKPRKPNTSQVLKAPSNLWQPPSSKTEEKADTDRMEVDSASRAKRSRSKSPSPGQAPTQIDKDDEDEPNGEATGNSAAAPAAPKTGTSPPLPTSRTAPGNTRHILGDPDDAQKAGWHHIDENGDGDCFYRAIACSRHWNLHGDPLDIPAAKREAAQLRTEMILHCHKRKDRLSQHFAPDTQETAHQRNGRPAATSIDEWITNHSDPKTWACGLSIQALAERKGLAIVIWKHTTTGWERYTFANKYDRRHYAALAKKEKPVVLVLKDSHYTSLCPPPDQSVPRSWLAENQTLLIDLTGNGPKATGPP